MTPSCSRTTRTERQRIGPVSLSGPTANSSSQDTSENRYICPGCGGIAPLARNVSNERHCISLCKAIASRTELVFFTSLGISMKIRNLEPSTALAESESIRNWEICAKLCTKWRGRGTFASLSGGALLEAAAARARTALEDTMERAPDEAVALCNGRSCVIRSAGTCGAGRFGF